MRGASDIPDEEELEKILNEERTLEAQPSTFQVELPRQAIAETDWRPIDEELEGDIFGPLDAVGDLPDLDTDIV